MEAHTIIGKLPIFLVWKFELFNMVSKIEIDLNQFWFPKFISLLDKQLPLTNIYELYSWNFRDNLEVQDSLFVN